VSSALDIKFLVFSALLMASGSCRNLAANNKGGKDEICSSWFLCFLLCGVWSRAGACHIWQLSVGVEGDVVCYKKIFNLEDM